MEVVIHLAAEPRHELEIGWEELTNPNLIATARMFDAAHDAGVRRVIFASSMHVMGCYEFDEPYASIVSGRLDGLDPAAIPLVKGDDPGRPDSRYGATKIFGESLGRYYTEGANIDRPDERPMEVICARLGTLPGFDRPEQTTAPSSAGSAIATPSASSAPASNAQTSPTRFSTAPPTTPGKSTTRLTPGTCSASFPGQRFRSLAQGLARAWPMLPARCGSLRQRQVTAWRARPMAGYSTTLPALPPFRVLDKKRPPLIMGAIPQGDLNENPHNRHQRYHRNFPGARPQPRPRCLRHRRQTVRLAQLLPGRPLRP